MTILIVKNAPVIKYQIFIERLAKPLLLARLVHIALTIRFVKVRNVFLAQATQSQIQIKQIVKNAPMTKSPTGRERVVKNAPATKSQIIPERVVYLAPGIKL
jgi:hypothetical protein